MRVALGHLGSSLSFALAVWVCLPLNSALAQQRSEESSSITNAEAAVAAPSPNTTRRSSLKDLEEQLRRSFRPFSPKGSLDGVLAPEYGAPPPAVVAPARKRNAAKDNNNGWIFPDDLTGDQNATDPFAMSEDGTDGKSRRKALADPYYRSLNRNAPNGGETPSLMGIDPANSLKKVPLGTSSGSSDDSNLPSGIRDSAQSLQKMLQRSSGDSDFSMPTGVKSSFSDFFGMGERSLTADQIQAHKNYLQQFQQLLDGSSASRGGSLPSSSSFLDGGSAMPGASSLSGSYGGLPKSSSSAGWNAFDSKPGAINPTLTPGALPDINAQVLNQWNAFSTPPPAETPRVTPPTPAYLNFPHRKF